MSEAHELAEKIHEVAHHADHAHMTDDNFRRGTGVLIGALACALAITSVGGSKAMKQTINANIETSDAYAFYQAKTLRQQVIQAASDELDVLLQSNPNMPPETVAAIHQKQDTYKKNIAHWESAPETGDGRKELLEKAKESMERRETAASKDEWFELAEALLQIAVVVASTSVLMASRRLFAVCAIFSVLGVLSSALGFLNLFEMPFGH